MRSHFPSHALSDSPLRTAMGRSALDKHKIAGGANLVLIPSNSIWLVLCGTDADFSDLM